MTSLNVSLGTIFIASSLAFVVSLILIVVVIASLTGGVWYTRVFILKVWNPVLLSNYYQSKPTTRQRGLNPPSVSDAAHGITRR